MILEVMYDAPNNMPHAEPDSEYVILYNNSCGDISLAGWELCDNAGCLTLEIGTLSQGTATAIINSPQRNRIQRSTFRYTNLSPDQVSSTAQTLMSTRP